MLKKLKFLLGGLAIAAMPVFAQTKPAFEVASIKLAAPLDMMKMAQAVQAGNMPKIGAHVDNSRAEYIYLSLRDLISIAYGVQPFQITGPDWLSKQRFDITAKLPAGSKKDEAPKMLQSLLEERFRFKFHKTNEEHPVLGLVVGKGGPKLKESTGTPKALDTEEPLKPGQMVQEGPDGPVKVTVGKAGSATVDMGLKGTMSYGMNPATQSFHLDGSMITMAGFADMLTQFSQMAGAGGRRIVDMTGLKGVYEVQMDFALADLLNMARSAGMDIPAGAGPGRGAGGPTSITVNPSDAATDPGGGTSSSITTAVQALGLKLENRKATIDQLIVDHAEQTPTEN